MVDFLSTVAVAAVGGAGLPFTGHGSRGTRS